MSRADTGPHGARTRLVAALLLLLVSAITMHPPLVAQPAGTARPVAPATRAPTSLAPLSDAEFAERVAALSEPGGFFDTDNLISNERSYLHALDAFERHGTSGGAFVGVGPDQGFSYIAHARSELAYLVDIRRDNLLQHLFYKALFAAARDRADYLALWLGRPRPDPSPRWAVADIDDLVRHLDSLPATPPDRATARDAVEAALRPLRVPLSEDDRATIDRIHATFMDAGLALRFTSFGRAPRPGYPTLRDLLRETDRRGVQRGYLATEAAFQYVKELQRRNRVIPVVGDLAGPHALRAIGRDAAARGLVVRLLYASNAEDYVMRDGGFARWVDNVRALPHDARSVIVRSWFGLSAVTQSVPGYTSTQLVQPVATFLEVARTELWGYPALVRSPHLP
jgi:hypothetical protein